MKNTINFKVIIAILITMFVAQLGYAQTVRSSYFLDKTPLRLSLNPAFVPEKGYVNIPILGGIGINIQSNSLSLDKLIFPGVGGQSVTFLDPSISSTDFLSGLSEDNRLNFDIELSIIGFGFHAAGGYWNVGVGLTSNTNSNIPKSLFEFAKKGTGVDGSTFNVDNFGINTTNYVDLSIGYSRKIGDDITVGGAAKFIVGAAGFDARIDNMKIVSSADKWHITTSGYLKGSLSGLELVTKTDADNGIDYVDSFGLNSFGVAGYGFAVDLGATYSPIDNLIVSAAITDLGFISWDKNATVSAISQGEFLFEGIDIPLNNSGTSINDQFDSILDDVTDLMRFEEEAIEENRVEMITMSFNLGAEYSILDDKIGFGVLYTGKVRPASYEQELTIISSFRPAKWFSAALSYSLLNNTYSSLGVVLNFSPSWINFYIGTDYMFTKINPQFIPVSQSAINLHFGIGIPIGNKSTKGAQAQNHREI